jgi:hypothetical protein
LSCKDTGTSFLSREKRYPNNNLTVKTGNAFVTESLPKPTIFCFFAARGGMWNDEIITVESGSCSVLSVLAV